MQDAAGRSPKCKDRATPMSAARSTRYTRKHKDKAKTTILPRQAGEEKVKEQARAAHKREQIRPGTNKGDQAHIYVGNVSCMSSATRSSS